MIYYLVTALHVMVCVILILVVLLQSGKGADLAGAFGGGATQTAFGSRGPASFLSKMTTAAAIVFMLTSITLTSVPRERGGGKSILETTGGTKAPAKAPAAQTTQPPAKAPSPDQIRQMQEQIEAKQKQAGSGAQTQPAQAPPAEAPGKSTTTPPGKKP